MRIARPFSNTDELQVVDLYVRKGVPKRAIAEKYQVHVKRISEILRKQGVKTFSLAESRKRKYVPCGNSCALESSCAGCSARYSRKGKLKRKYGLTLDQYETLLVKQNNTCAICFKKPIGRALAVDHNHETGEVRGLLCSNCNVGLGLYSDDPRLLRNAADYIESRKGDA